MKKQQKRPHNIWAMTCKHGDGVVELIALFNRKPKAWTAARHLRRALKKHGIRFLFDDFIPGAIELRKGGAVVVGDKTFTLKITKVWRYDGLDEGYNKQYRRCFGGVRRVKEKPSE